MKYAIAFLLALAHLFLQVQGYTHCSYSYYSYGTRRTTYYTCSNSEYCCSSGRCCTMVYARWYLWFVLVTLFIVFFLIWWYYRYRYRPRQAIIRTSAPVPIVHTSTTVSTYPGQQGLPGSQSYSYPVGTVIPYSQQKVPQPYPQGFAPPPSYETATAYPYPGPAYPPNNPPVNPPNGPR